MQYDRIIFEYRVIIFKCRLFSQCSSLFFSRLDSKSIQQEHGINLIHTCYVAHLKINMLEIGYSVDITCTYSEILLNRR